MMDGSLALLCLHPWDGMGWDGMGRDAALLSCGGVLCLLTRRLFLPASTCVPGFSYKGLVLLGVGVAQGIEVSALFAMHVRVWNSRGSV